MKKTSAAHEKIKSAPVIEIILQEVPYKIFKAYLESQKKKEEK